MVPAASLTDVVGADGLVGVGDRPAEAGQLARDGDVCDGRALAVFSQDAVAMLKANLSLPGTDRDLGWDVSLKPHSSGGLARTVAVVPGGLDEEPPRVAIAGLGDVPSMLLFT